MFSIWQRMIVRLELSSRPGTFKIGSKSARLTAQWRQRSCSGWLTAQGQVSA
jgi:hypothetical protein